MNATSTIVAYIVSTSTDATQTWGMDSQVISAAVTTLGFILSGILGAAISAYATSRQNTAEDERLKKTLDAQLLREEVGRLFTARKEGYSKAIGLITHTLLERANGRMYPDATSEAGNKILGDMIAELSIIASKDLSPILEHIFDFLGSPIPKDIKAIERDKLKESVLVQKLLTQMRLDINVGEYLDTPMINNELMNQLMKSPEHPLNP